MTLRIQLMITIFTILGLIVLIAMIRRKQLEFRYALVWMIAGICILILTIFPGIISALASVMGIRSPMNLLFFLGFCLSLMILFDLTIFASQTHRKMKRLAQEIALLEREKKTEVDEDETMKH